VAVTLLFGLAPAARLARSSAGRALGGAARAGDRREARSRSFLLAAEVGLSVVLLAGAGLFLRSLAELQSVDLGFDESEVVRFTPYPPEARYAELSQISAFYRELEDRLAALPGVEAVGSSWDPPLGSGRIYGTVRVEGRPEAEPGQETNAAIRSMTPGFFDALGLRLLRGRTIEETDLEHTEGVAVVNETFVRENFPGEDPMGRVFRVSANFGWRVDGFRVVGVVADVRRTPTAPPASAIYVALAQFGPETLAVHVRGSASTQGIVAAAREIVRDMDPNVPLSRVETMAQAMARATGTARFYLALVAGFAGLAVVMAGVGLFGVVSFLVSRRTREIGIRVALGAGATRVRGMVLAQGLIPALWGVLGGVLATLAAGRLVESLLFQVHARDPLVLSAVVVLLVLLTGLATLIPARRATRLDPVQALRAE
jgi:predicted permease